MGPFDRAAVRAHRRRATRTLDTVRPLLDALAARADERLDDLRTPPTRALEIGGRGSLAPLIRARGIDTISADLSGGDLALDEEYLPFGENTFDLIACLSLAWVNDVPGALIQMRRALRPGGLFVAVLPALGTLAELRAALTAAEAELTGGAAPRVSPFPDLPDCAALLSRAGFSGPVADTDTLTLSYADPYALLSDLRAAGETNALTLRARTIPPKALFPLAMSLMPRDGQNRVPVTVRLVTLTGWV